MTLLFLPSSPSSASLALSSHPREEILFARASLSFSLSVCFSSLHITLNILLCFLHNFRSPAGSHAASTNTFRGKGDRDRKMGDCREERLRNIPKRRRPCSSRGKLLFRTVSDEKIRIINAERAREVRRRYIVPGVWKLRLLAWLKESLRNKKILKRKNFLKNLTGRRYFAVDIKYLGEEIDAKFCQQR